MGEFLKKIKDAIANYRSGDRIVMDNGFSIDTALYRKSNKSKPYFSFGYDGSFTLTLLEVLLITVAITVVVTLCVSKCCRKIGNFFSPSESKSANK